MESRKKKLTFRWTSYHTTSRTNVPLYALAHGLKKPLVGSVDTSIQKRIDVETLINFGEQIIQVPQAEIALLVVAKGKVPIIILGHCADMVIAKQQFGYLLFLTCR